MNKLIILVVATIVSLIGFAQEARAGSEWATCSSIGFCGVNPSLPVFGPGPLTNLGNPTANLNAALHISAAIGLPLLGQALWGKQGKMAVGLSWIALTLIQEVVFHAPQDQSGAYPSEVRTDLLTRILPTIVILSF